MDRAFVSPELQVAYPEVFGNPGAVRFMGSLLSLLGENGAIGPRMARVLVGWKWPPLRQSTDPSWRWLYVAKQAPAGIVKIGISANPVERMKSLPADRGHGGRFDLVAVVPRCGIEHESALCELFGDSRLAGNEWFRNTLATRILCWNAAEQRNPSPHDEHWARWGREFDQALRALGGISGGLAPDAVFRRRRSEYRAAKRRQTLAAKRVRLAAVSAAGTDGAR